MRKTLFIFSVAALLCGCRSHKEIVKSDSISVHQVHSSQTLQQLRDSTSAFDSFRIDMQNVKIFVFQDSNMVTSQGIDTAQASGPAGFFPGIIASMMGRQRIMSAPTTIRTIPQTGKGFLVGAA